jgi:predicted nuclease of predicted toxin-antitoxin system
MKLLIDMNLSPRWVKLLADADIEAVHWASIGVATARDVDIMDFARLNGYVVLTHESRLWGHLSSHTWQQT